jgi:hypothetical protein
MHPGCVEETWRVVGRVAACMTDPVSESPAAPRGGRVWWAGVGLVAAGTAASVLALLLPTEPPRPDGLPVWVWVAVAGLLMVGIRVAMLAWRSARLESPRTNPVWWRVARSHAMWWRILLGVGAVVVGTWAVLACIADIRSGLPGPAIPWLAVGCVALLVAAVLLSVSPSPVRRGSVVRQALPAALAVVTVVASAVTVDVVGWRIPVDATTTERVDRAGVPDLPRDVRWTWQSPRTWLTEEFLDPVEVEVVAAGAGLVVASGDRMVALDGSTGAERWHYRRAGASIVDLTASPSGRTVLADFAAGGAGFSSSELFAFDADTGELRWNREVDGVATEHVLAEGTDDGGLVAVDLISGEEVWTWTPPSNCESSLPAAERSTVTVLVPLTCRDRAGHRLPTVIGVEDRTGTEEWRYTGPPETEEDALVGELTTTPDGHAAWYRALASTEPVLLEPNTGAVLYPSSDGTDIVGSDGRYSVVLRRFDPVDPKGDRLVLRDLITGAEHPLPSTCPVLGPEDSDEAVLQTVVTQGSDREPGSVLMLCFDGREEFTTRADVDVYSADGTRRTTIEVDDDVSAVRESSYFPDLNAAPGAVVLVAHGSETKPTVIVGLG